MNNFLDKILRPVIGPVAKVLAALYGVTNSYAGAIALLTLAMMLLLLPLTLKSTKSMLEMQKVQPLIKQLQQDYKNDIQGRNEAMMALYKEHKINPAGGCLPMLLQMPFFMTMWRVLYGLTVRCGQRGEAKCAEGQPTFFSPKYLQHDSQLYKSLAGKTEMKSLGLDLSKAAFRVIQDNVVRGLPYLALVILVGLLSYFQQRQMTARNTGSAVNPQQQMIMNLMPIFFGFISLTFASGLIIYFLVQNVFRIAQNAYITKKFFSDTPTAGSAVIEAKAKDSSTANRPKPAGYTPPSNGKGKGDDTPTSAAGKTPRPKPTPSGSSARPKPPAKNPSAPNPARPKPKKK
jgi:YidC/Oxa1 family membrane protein insertase